MLLDAVGAATEKLVITYTGANEYSGRRGRLGARWPTAGHLDMTTQNKIRGGIVVVHPLQPFDIRNVEPGRLVPKVPFSFDPTVLRAARASTGQRGESPSSSAGRCRRRRPMTLASPTSSGSSKIR